MLVKIPVAFVSHIGAQADCASAHGPVPLICLLSIAAELFLAQGYAAVSVDEIIQKAGQSKTNVYSWFGGKSGLFLATVDKLCVDILAPLATLDCAGAPLRWGLCEIAETLLMAIAPKRPIALHRLVVAEAVSFPKIAQKWNSDGPEHVHQILAQFIEGHQRAGWRRLLTISEEHPCWPSGKVRRFSSRNRENQPLFR